MNKYDIVCDLGSNYVRAMSVGGFVVKDPSVIALDITDKSIKGAGTSALKLHSNELSNVTLSYPIRDGAIIDPNGASQLLAHTFSKLLGNSVFNKTTVYVVVPCSLAKGEKETIDSVFNSINVKQIKFLSAPLADAKRIFGEFCVSCGIICDIGAEVTDICAVVDDKIVSGCSIFCGGNDITNAIVEQIANRYFVRILPQEAENLKVSCASLYLNDISTYNVRGLNTVKGTDEQISVSAKEMFSTVAEIIKRYCKIVESILQSVPKDIATQLRNEGIFLCGGGSKMTGLEKFLFAGLKMNVRVPTMPDDVAVYGGEMLAKQLLK